MSVADVLSKIGDWTESKKLAQIVAKEHNVVEETAYRRMKREANDKLIRKKPLPDWSVICVLPNWPLKEDHIRLLIDVLNASSLSTLANVKFLEAMAKFIEATKK
jgi:hypothetical protein